MTSYPYTVITALGTETVTWNLSSRSAAAAINTALEFTGPGSTLVRCTRQGDW